MSISDQDLANLESDVGRALQTGDHSQLSVLGFGEISVALGYPTESPTHACKRTPPFSPQQLADYRQLVGEYVERLRTAGVAVVDSEVRSVPRADGDIAYLVQPLLRSETLGHNVLRAAEPDPDHPLLVAVGRAIQIASPTISIDAQITNWSWDGDGDGLTLIDVGTPFLWDEQGRPRFEMTPYLTMLPGPVRRVVKAELTKMLGRWREPRGVAADVVANLHREGLDDWVQPALTALNRALPDGPPIQADEARALYEEDLKTWPRLTRLKRLERAWQTRIRRRPYDFFIQTTVGQDALF